MEEKKLAVLETAYERLYDKDSYRKEFTARVLRCEKKGKGYRIALDRTAFFPEGGGQAGDQGWLNDCRVTNTREEGGLIWHELSAPLPEGTAVEGRLDFPVRFDRMQQHTGEHILSGIVHRLYGYENVGFHLGEELTTLDFNGELTREQLREAERRANEAVCANLPVQVSYPSREELEALEYRSKIEIEGQVRIVSIPGYDVCACCAPHVARTGEISLLKTLSLERHRGGCRVTMVCGFRALSDYGRRLESVGEVSAALSAKPEEIGAAVRHLKEQQERLREQLNRVQELYLQQKLEKIGAETRNVCIFESEVDSVALRNFVNGTMERCPGICGAFLGSDEGGWRYILGSRTADMREFSRKLNDRFQGKGGGKPEMVQGSLKGAREEIQAFFQKA